MLCVARDGGDGGGGGAGELRSDRSKLNVPPMMLIKHKYNH